MKIGWLMLFVFVLSLFWQAPIKAQTPVTATPPSPPLDLVETGVNLPGGDCLEPQRMRIDQSAERLYVLCRFSDQDEADALLVLNSRTYERQALVHLDKRWFPEYAHQEVGSGLNSLTLDSQANLLYVRSSDWKGVLVLDTTTLTKRSWLPLGRSTIFAAAQERFYVGENWNLVAYQADNLTEVARVPLIYPLAAYYYPADQRLYLVAINESGGAEFQIRRSDDLTLETTLPLPIQKLQAATFNSQLGRLYLANDSGDSSDVKHQLLLVDGQTQTVTTQDLDSLVNPDNVDPLLRVDEASGRLTLIDLNSGQWLVFDGQTLVTVSQQQRTDRCLSPNNTADAVIDSNGQLLLASSSGTMLHRYNPLTGELQPALPLGRRLVAAAVHPQDGRLYWLDSLGALNVLNGASLEPLNHRPQVIAEICAHQGDNAYLALDPKHQHLFIGDLWNNQTLVLDLETLDPLATLAGAGPLALDAAGGRLFLAGCAEDKTYLHTFDTTALAESMAREIGPCQRTTLADLSFDEPSGRLFFQAAVKSEASGGSGAGAGQSYRLYDADTLAEMDTLYSQAHWAESLAFSPGGQRTYMTLTGYMTSFGAFPKVNWLLISDQAGRLLRQINGPHGLLAADKRYLYLLEDQSLLALDAQKLEKTPNQPYLAAILPLQQSYPALELAKQMYSSSVLDLTHAYDSLTLAQGRLYMWNERQLATISTASLLAHPDAPPQRNPVEIESTARPPLKVVGHLGGTPGPLAVKGNYAYATFGPELAILDLTTPTQPRRVGYTLLPTKPDENGNNLNVINHLAVAGNYVYVATTQAGLRIIEVADPTALREVGVYKSSLPWATETIQQVVIAGQYAYLASGAGGLRIVDISNPVAPEEVGFYEFEASAVKGVAVVQLNGRTYAYVVGASGPELYTNKLHLLDVSDPARPTELDLVIPEAAFDYVQVKDHFLYSASTMPGYEAVWDITNPTAPVETHSEGDLLFLTEMIQNKAALAGNYAFVLTEEGLKVMDTAHPAAPVEVGAYLTSFRDKTLINGEYAYLIQSNKLTIVDLSNPARPDLAGVYELDPNAEAYEIKQMALVGPYLYVLEGAGLRVLDVTRPTDPLEVGFFDDFAHASDLVVIEGKAYLTSLCSNGFGLRVLDISTPARPVAKICYQTFPKEVSSYDLIIKGQEIYLKLGLQWGLLDLSNLAHPTLLPPPFFDEYMPKNDFEVNGSYLALLTDSPFSGLRVIDLSDRFNPVTAGVYEMATSELQFSNIGMAGEYVYTISQPQGFFLFRLN